MNQVSKKTPPLAFGVGSGLLPAAVDGEAIQVQKYAEEHPIDDLEHQPIAQARLAEGSSEPKVIEGKPTAPTHQNLKQKPPAIGKRGGKPAYV